MNPYIYTFIRRDISPEQKIVQLGHATWEAGLRFERPGEIASLILLTADDEQDLISISRKLDQRGIEHYIFFEPDNGMGNSAICTRPVYDKTERNFFKRYRLYTT
jgi:hypothetical protein